MRMRVNLMLPSVDNVYVTFKNVLRCVLQHVPCNFRRSSSRGSDRSFILFPEERRCCPRPGSWPLWSSWCRASTPTLSWTSSMRRESGRQPSCRPSWLSTRRRRRRLGHHSWCPARLLTKTPQTSSSAPGDVTGSPRCLSRSRGCTATWGPGSRASLSSVPTKSKSYIWYILISIISPEGAQEVTLSVRLYVCQFMCPWFLFCFLVLFLPLPQTGKSSSILFGEIPSKILSILQ